MKLAALLGIEELTAEQKAKLASADATISAIETERDNLKASLATRDTELATANAAIVKHGDEIAAANKLATDAKAETDALKVTHAADLEKVKASVGHVAAVKALEITGQQVTAPVPAEKAKATDGKKNYTELCREAKAAGK